jgi:hypothetical protein
MHGERNLGVVDAITTGSNGLGARAIQRIETGWTFTLTAVCSSVTRVTLASVLKSGVPSFIVTYHESLIVVIVVLDVTRAVFWAVNGTG